MPSITEAIARRTLSAARLQTEINSRRQELLPVIERSANELIAAIRALKEVEDLLRDNQERLEVTSAKEKEEQVVDQDHLEELRHIATIAVNMEDVFMRSDADLWRGMLKIVDVPVYEHALEGQEEKRLLLLEAAIQRVILKKRQPTDE